MGPSLAAHGHPAQAVHLTWPSFSPQDGSLAGTPAAASTRAEPRVPGSLRPGPATGHQPFPTDVRGQWG